VGILPRYRLRYRSADLVIPVGDFVIGRSSNCDLAIDDAVVSRRHAVLHVDPIGMSLEDLGSSNGVHVNGRRVEGSQKLGHLDRISIGSHEIVILQISGATVGQATMKIRICLNCTRPLEGQPSICPHCGQDPLSRPAEGAPAPALVPIKSEASASFRMLGPIADKAMGMGRFEEAERLLATHLEAMLRGASAATPRSTVEDGTRIALRLGKGLGSPRWLTFLFDLNTAAERILDRKTVEDLHTLARKIGYRDVASLRAYLAWIRSRESSISASDRFVLRRLESLERVICA